jgi:hypothetical protein
MSPSPAPYSRRSTQDWTRSAASVALLAVAVLALSSDRAFAGTVADEESWTKTTLAARVVGAMTAAAREWSRPAVSSTFDVLLAGDSFRVSENPECAGRVVPQSTRFVVRPPILAEHFLSLPPPTM